MSHFAQNHLTKLVYMLLRHTNLRKEAVLMRSRRDHVHVRVDSDIVEKLLWHNRPKILERDDFLPDLRHLRLLPFTVRQREDLLHEAFVLVHRRTIDGHLLNA